MRAHSGEGAGGGESAAAGAIGNVDAGKFRPEVKPKGLNLQFK
jgi:hypothetical protein